MKHYNLTAFERTGEKVIDEAFTAQNNEEAKAWTDRKLNEEGFSDLPHRCVTDNAKLVSFHR